ncbi:hypothetical protein T265_01316 [Opisthorchis viverrini]|uniref:Uncharacterized protein n=1 Tax=Opisthorchis viverrini TaxID=6198 RepID=A0A074ZYU7_OPIVI|nr:hypothetical protein T265_01316 [Opisthorchis viverrini]KER32628.1 hypothetical protein T265_01316 [Opisthorchis viverrini]
MYFAYWRNIASYTTLSSLVSDGQRSMNTLTSQLSRVGNSRLPRWAPPVETNQRYRLDESWSALFQLHGFVRSSVSSLLSFQLIPDTPMGKPHWELWPVQMHEGLLAALQTGSH